MNIDYMSDLHIDFWVPFNKNQIKWEKKTKEFAEKLIPTSPSSVLALGGDIGHYNRQNTWFLEALSVIYSTILIVFGNHDYYLISKRQSKKYHRNSYHRTEEMKQMVPSNMRFLEGDIVEIEGVKLGGTGMWYDFSYGTKHQTYEEVKQTWRTHSNDFHLIKGLTPENHFQQEQERLINVIQEADILFTHMGPDWTITPYENEKHIHNSYYFFDGKELIEKYKPRIWCFGHVHHPIEIEKNNCRFINHTLGYPDENLFHPFKTITI